MWQPHIIPSGYKTYTLVEDYCYSWVPRSTIGEKKRPMLKTISVPKNFTYDGASVPRILWTLTGLTPDGMHRAASLIHDYIYSYDGKLPTGAMKVQYIDVESGQEELIYPQGKWSRKSCDLLFKKMLKESGLPTYKVYGMYYFVRVFGWVKWKS